MTVESVPTPDAHQHTAPATSVPHPDRGDPRLPHLRNATGFVDYMKTGWATPDRTLDTVPGIAAATAAHRARLSPAFAGRTIVVAGGVAPVRVNDNYYGFRPDSNFFWLSGCSAEDAVLVMSPAAGGHDATLFIPAPAYPGEADFFANAAQGELWVGSAPGMPEWTAALQIETRPLSELDAAVARASDIALTGSLQGAHRLLRDIPVSQDLGRVLSEIRMIKDEWEIAELRGAVNHTIEGFKAVAREIPQAIEFGGERWLQGTFDRYARTVGNGTGYTTIVGSGKNAPVLHWVRCDGPVNPDAAVLLDMGVEARSLYTADVTRTLPASGTFSAAQRQAHDLVEKAHRAGLAAVGPGKIFSDFHLAALEVIATGLHDWGMLPVSVDEALSPQGQHHRRYIVCGIGHHLGLDVHDCAQSSYSAYQSGELVPGMVMAVEPGLYFHEWDNTVPPELRGLGVRIEDNVMVTPNGHEVLSDALPITADGIEGWMRAL